MAGAPVLLPRLAARAPGTPGPRWGLGKKGKRLGLNSVLAKGNTPRF